MNHGSRIQNGLFDPVTPKACHIDYIPRTFPMISLNTFGSFFSELCRQTNGQTDGQTDIQTDGLENPTHADDIVLYKVICRHIYTL